jgi:hypothetical protein
MHLNWLTPTSSHCSQQDPQRHATPHEDTPWPLNKKSYQSTNEEQNKGTGQGSGGSPAIWLIFMVTLLTAFRQFTPGMKVVSPFDSLLVLIVTIYYVNDGMSGVNDSDSVEPKTLAFLVEAAESSARSWEGLLFISGGGLELSKCFTYILRWAFDSGMYPRLMLPGEIDGCVRSSDKLAHLPISEIDSDHWPEQIISVIGPRGRICGRLQEEIRFCCTDPTLISYWTERYNWADDTNQRLDQSGSSNLLTRLRRLDSRSETTMWLASSESTS